MGGFTFLLITDFNIDKLPVSLSEFHKQLLLYWKIIYMYTHPILLYSEITVIYYTRISLYFIKIVFREIYGQYLT